MAQILERRSETPAFQFRAGSPGQTPHGDVDQCRESSVAPEILFHRGRAGDREQPFAQQQGLADRALSFRWRCSEIKLFASVAKWLAGRACMPANNGQVNTNCSDVLLRFGDMSVLNLSEDAFRVF